MKLRLIAIASACLLITACDSKDKDDDDKMENKTTGPMEYPALATDSAGMAAMMKAWQDYATPGAPHAWMAKMTGTWTCDSVKQWMDPSQPPTTSSATEVISMALNGLYQFSDFSSTMMGMPMQGHGIMGYDNMKKKYVLSWVDNLGSGIVRMEGSYDEPGMTLSMSGKQSDPGRNMETDIRQEIKFQGDDTYTMSMYGTGADGKSEMKFMEGTFHRKK